MHLSNNTLLQGGKYKIVRFISSGGFGCTYEAEHVMLHKRVAIKEFFVKDFCNRDETTSQISVGITSKTALVDKLKKKFVEEAQSLCALKHPNIVHVFDVFEDNGTAYYVMDYIDGPSLNDLVKKNGPMSESKALEYIKQVADALKYVHSRNRLHLDIKPGNIMVDDKDRAILIDFGASKQYDEEAGENTSTLLGKTPGYAPLEQMGNDVVKFLPSTDIYALGATLYKLLTGVTPPSASLLASGETLEEMPAFISFGTRNAVIMSMQTNKMKRPQNVDDFCNLLSTRGMSSSNCDDSTIVEDAENDHTIIEEEAVDSTKKRENKITDKAKTSSKEQKYLTNKGKTNSILTNNSIINQDLKFDFWLKFFLFVICANGIVSFVMPIIRYPVYKIPALAFADILLGFMQCILSFITLNAFIKRKIDAVFLGKLCIVIPFFFSLITMLTGSYEESGIGNMGQVLRSLVSGIIWFVYLCVSKRVEAIIPSSSRKTLNRDYIICALFAITVIYSFAFGQVASDFNSPISEEVTNEIYEHETGNVSYTGQVKDGLPHGKGVGVYPQGLYEGEYQAGIRQGEGTFTDAEGGVFTGTFVGDEYYNGKYVMKNGTYYIGTFQNQQPYNGVWYNKTCVAISRVENGKER